MYLFWRHQWRWSLFHERLLPSALWETLNQVKPLGLLNETWVGWLVIQCKSSKKYLLGLRRTKSLYRARLIIYLSSWGSRTRQLPTQHACRRFCLNSTTKLFCDQRTMETRAFFPNKLLSSPCVHSFILPNCCVQCLLFKLSSDSWWK